MLGELMWSDDIGAVGCKLLYEFGRVQHAGVIIGVGEGGIADHPFRGLSKDDPGYVGRALCSQELSAVTAACLLCRRDAFDKVGGFDDINLKVAYNDVDLCLKLRAAGFKVVFRAETIAEHLEFASREDDMRPHRFARLLDEQNVMRARWGEVLAHDPYYNKNFCRERGIFSTLKEENE